jgi:hypothetical protein
MRWNNPQAKLRATYAAVAKSILASAVLAQGKHMEACARAAAALNLSKGVEDQLATLYTTLRSASVEARCGKPAESEKTLRGTIERAGKTHLTRIELEARIHLARLHRDLQNRSAAAQEIEAIEQQAKVRGYIRLTREAASLRG